jgi:ppGpp synthetase/RelA/SpoT-type nucleotidyltranferase
MTASPLSSGLLDGLIKEILAVERKLIVPDSPHKFGYERQHFILFVPQDVLDDSSREDGAPLFFELQVKTLFQHAWGRRNTIWDTSPQNP